MAKFEPGVWLTEGEELTSVVAEKSGKQRKVMLLTNRRLALIQHIDGGWRFIEDRLWKDFDSVGVEHRSWGKSFLFVKFNPSLKVEDGLWNLCKVDKKQATPAYKEMKERELKRREMPPKKPIKSPQKKDELPKDARYVFNIDSKGCKAEEIMKEKLASSASAGGKSPPTPTAKGDKPKDDKPKDDKSKSDENTPPAENKKSEQPPKTENAGEGESIPEEALRAEGQQALMETIKGFMDSLLKK